MSKIRKPSQLEVQSTIRVLIYGQPGLGKTTLALSAPAPLLLDFDRGVHRVRPEYQTDTVQIERWEDVIEVLAEDLTPFKTFVIDTAGKLLDFMTEYLIRQDPKLAKKDGSLQLQGYGARKALFQNFLRQVSMMGKHLIFVAHDKEEKDGDQKIIRPEIGGSSGNDLIKELDLVGYMEAVGKNRTISFDPCEKFYGKNTCGLPSVISVPVLEDSKQNTYMGSVFDIYQKHLEERKQMAEDYNDLMGVIAEKVDRIEDAETANDVSEFLKNFKEFIWDAKLQSSYLLRDKAKELGLTINKKTKAYEDATQPADA